MVILRRIQPLQHFELEILVGEAKLRAVADGRFHIALNHRSVHVGVVGGIGIHHEVLSVTGNDIRMAAADGRIVANGVIYLSRGIFSLFFTRIR